MTARPPVRLRVLVASPIPAEVGAVAAAPGIAGHEVVTAYGLDAAIARLSAEPSEHPGRARPRPTAQGRLGGARVAESGRSPTGSQ